MKIGYPKGPDFAPFRAGANKIRWWIFYIDCTAFFLFFLICFSPMFFSFPGPPRRVEKNGASKLCSVRKNKYI